MALACSRSGMGEWRVGHSFSFDSLGSSSGEDWVSSSTWVCRSLIEGQRGSLTTEEWNLMEVE
jgi:hypothetical protein